MRELRVHFSQDPDGPVATLEIAPELRVRWGGRALEVSLLFEHDDTDRDPVLAFRDLGTGEDLLRSPPLPGQHFLDLREIWRTRRGEGFSLQAPGNGELPVRVWALDFEGNLARGRIHEQAGRLEQALAAYQASASPSREDEVRRIQALLAGSRASDPQSGASSGSGSISPSPASGSPEEIEGEEVVLHILRAIAADGKVDSREMRTLKALGPAFQVPGPRLQELIQQVRDEGVGAEGGAMVPAQVLRELLTRAARGGRIGPRSSALLKRASHALGLTKDDVKAILAGS